MRSSPEMMFAVNEHPIRLRSATDAVESSLGYPRSWRVQVMAVKHRLFTAARSWLPILYALTFTPWVKCHAMSYQVRRNQSHAEKCGPSSFMDSPSDAERVLKRLYKFAATGCCKPQCCPEYKGKKEISLIGIEEERGICGYPAPLGKVVMCAESAP